MTDSNPTSVRLDLNALSGLDLQVFAWLTHHFGAAPSALNRQLRWRVGWEADVLVDGQPKTVLVRMNRGDDFVGPLTMHQEAAVHGVMERHGVAAPHVHGVIDAPLAIVMDLLPGGINTGLIASETTRKKIRTAFIETLARLHAIPIEEFGRIGLKLPTTPREIAFGLYGACIDIVRQKMAGRPFGLVEFFARWLERNVPLDRTRAGFVTADAGQFLYAGDAFTGLIDFEVAYVGDPAAEFGGMRLRDTTEPLGNISALCDHYETLTGDRISKRVIEFHTAGFASTNSMLMWPMMFEPELQNDYVAYLHFCVATSRWGLGAMAEFAGVTLAPVPEPISNCATFEAAPALLVAQLRSLATDPPAHNQRLDSATVLATYLERCQRFGASVLAADLDAAADLLGHRPATSAAADTAIYDLCRTAGPDSDPALIRYFHGWLQRQNFLLIGCGSQAYLCQTTLQPIPPRPADAAPRKTVAAA